jgi:hypothetical protein
MRYSMSNLLFFSRSSAYRHAARTELYRARMLPPGFERNQARKRAKALRDLARNEAWLEGQTLQAHRSHPPFVTPWVTSGVSIAHAGADENVLPRQQQALISRRRVNVDGFDRALVDGSLVDGSLAASVPDPQSSH